MKDELGGQIITKFAGLRPKTYSYLKDNNGECKNAKGTKKCVAERMLKFEYCKKCVKTSQIINIVNYSEKRGINVDNLKEDKKEFIKNRLILKTKQRFKGERHNVFTEEINKIALSPNNDKRIQQLIQWKNIHTEWIKISYGRKKKLNLLI